jgi:hypothetical protein
MKKIITSLLIAAGIFLIGHDSTAQVQYEKGDVLINAGLGFGYFYAGGVPFIASAEFAINDAISIGPYIGFTSYRYKYFGGRYTYTFIDVGARGSYHFSKHINMNTDKLDLYGGVMLGYTASSFSGDNNNGFNDPYGSRLSAGLFAGARWYFSEAFAVNGELGYGIAPLLLGVTFKL